MIWRDTFTHGKSNAWLLIFERLNDFLLQFWFLWFFIFAKNEMGQVTNTIFIYKKEKKNQHINKNIDTFGENMKQRKQKKKKRIYSSQDHIISIYLRFFIFSTLIVCAFAFRFQYSMSIKIKFFFLSLHFLLLFFFYFVVAFMPYQDFPLILAINKIA